MSEPEDEPKVEKPAPRRRRVEVLNALMFRVSAEGELRFIWPHSENVDAYRKRGFVLLVDAATISAEDAKAAEIDAIRQQEEDLWRQKKSFEEWRDSFKRREGE